MGTSSAFGGQGGGTPLVPSWLGDDGAPPAAPDGGPLDPAQPPDGAPADGAPPAAPPAPPARPPVPPIADPTRFLAARNNFHDDNVAGLEGGHQSLLDISAEALAIDRPVEDTRRGEPVAA